MASGAGQLHCLVFLSNFGGNVHAVDDNGATPMQEAAIKGRIECIRHLETLITHQISQDRIKVEKMQLKAKRDAEKRIKEKARLLQKLDRDYEKRTAKHRKALGLPGNIVGVPVSIRNGNNNENIPDGTNRKQTYSQLTGLLRSDGESTEYESSRSNIDDELSSNESYKRIDDDFLGHTSQTSDDIVFDRRQFLHNESDQQSQSTEETEVSRKHTPQNIRSLQTNNDFIQNGRYANRNFNSNLPGEVVTLKNGQIVSNLNNSQSSGTSNGANQPIIMNGTNGNPDNLPPSKRNGQTVGIAKNRMAPLYTFLHALQLDEYREVFIREKIDLRACLLCDENDLREIGLPLGPRKKIVDAINKRNQAVKSNSHNMHDSTV